MIDNSIKLSERPDVADPQKVENDLTATLSSRFLAPFSDGFFGLSLLFLVLSGAVYVAYDHWGEPTARGNNNTMVFMLHYGLAVTFSIILWTGGYFKFSDPYHASKRPTRWTGMLLWLISAYALNRDMAVFQQSTAWLCWALTGIGFAMVLYTWKESFSIRAQQWLYAVLAIGWWLFTYLSLYVVELYPVSVPLLIALGLSAHTFVPITFAIVIGKRLWQDAQQEEHLRFGIRVGLILPLLIAGLFLYGWRSDLKLIEQTKQDATIRKTSDLPDWILIAQQLKTQPNAFNFLQPGWITNRLLLNKQVYAQGRFFNGANTGLSGLTALDAVRQHDPLVVIASQLFPADVLSEADQLSLVKVLLADRHGAEEKFWTGRHLTVEDVVSQVRIWPQFRLSYTEKTIRIRNQARFATEEALLTFHLPAGSVVSSMSLWVNGREEAARLTTVAKADTAYRTIVGVESRNFARDPSVVYWQEGNRITVRVFPCRAGDDRRVKIGITSPLQLAGEQLIYQNPSFDGPNAHSANELVHIDFASTPNAVETPWLFDNLTGNQLTHRGHYEPDWQLTFLAPTASTEAFVLDGQAYRLEAYKPVNEPFTPTDIYLDLNASWDKEQVTNVFQTVTKHGHSRVWVFEDGLKQLTDQNLDDTFEHLSQQQFSLFPVYRIKNPATALLITKGTPVSPILADLRKSRFAENFDMLSGQTVPIRTVCLAPKPGIDALPDYLKTLTELRVLNVLSVTTSDLITLLDKTKQFPRQPDSPLRIVLPEAGIAIQQTPAQTVKTSAAPDHLARLFLYNQLLQRIGRHYFTKNYQTDSLIQQAQRANVVSPLSSLIVLETAKDYERFDIKKDKLGLDNATLKEEGAVPEPHEWALIAMGLCVLGWLLWKKYHVYA
ncbi:XrtN system VIT domain-containing protein [Spirosoma aerophilum]